MKIKSLFFSCSKTTLELFLIDEPEFLDQFYSMLLGLHEYPDKASEFFDRLNDFFSNQKNERIKQRWDDIKFLPANAIYDMWVEEMEVILSQKKSLEEQFFRLSGRKLPPLFTYKNGVLNISKDSLPSLSEKKQLKCAAGFGLTEVLNEKLGSHPSNWQLKKIFFISVSLNQIQNIQWLYDHFEIIKHLCITQFYYILVHSPDTALGLWNTCFSQDQQKAALADLTEEETSTRSFLEALNVLIKKSKRYEKYDLLAAQYLWKIYVELELPMGDLKHLRTILTGVHNTSYCGSVFNYFFNINKIFQEDPNCKEYLLENWDLIPWKYFSFTDCYSFIKDLDDSQQTRLFQRRRQEKIYELFRFDTPILDEKEAEHFWDLLSLYQNKLALDDFTIFTLRPLDLLFEVAGGCLPLFKKVWEKQLSLLDQSPKLKKLMTRDYAGSDTFGSSVQYHFLSFNLETLSWFLTEFKKINPETDYYEEVLASIILTRIRSVRECTLSQFDLVLSMFPDNTQSQCRLFSALLEAMIAAKRNAGLLQWWIINYPEELNLDTLITDRLIQQALGNEDWRVSYYLLKLKFKNFTEEAREIFLSAKKNEIFLEVIERIESNQSVSICEGSLCSHNSN